MASTATPFDKARLKQKTRRDLAKGYTATKTTVLGKLEKIGDGLAHLVKSDYDTIAVAYLANPEILIAWFKLASNVDVQSIRGFLVSGGEQLGFGVTWRQALVFTDNEDNLHAEMAIVKFLVGLGIKKNDLAAGGLEIYCEKGVCPDCSGWLVKHGIPHYKTRKTVAGKGWTNPLTDANYLRTGMDLAYAKHGITYSAGKPNGW